jgi:hypothetical protein
MKWAGEAGLKLVLEIQELDMDTPLFQHQRKTEAGLTGRPPKILMHEGRRSIL